MIDEQVQSPSRGERMILPQHLQDMAACASKITIISDNAKPPPLSPWSPLFREERGLPPLGGVDSKNSSSDGSRRKSESRWDSMPQPKRLSDDSIAPFPSLAKIRQCGYLQGQDIGYGIPMPDDDHDGPCNPSSSNTTEGENTNNNHNNEEKPERGLNLPRRRESFEVSRDFTHTDSVSLLSQVLSAFDLSDEEDDEDGENFMLPPPPPPPGRFSSPTQPMQVLGDSRPALSPEQTEKKVGSDTLSIPVRRASIDSVDFLLSEEDLEGFFTDEDDTEHADLADEFEDSDEEEEEEEEEETEFCDDTEDGEVDSSGTDEEEDGDSFHNHYKDDSTLVSATTATTSTTLSTLRSTDPRDVPTRR